MKPLSPDSAPDSAQCTPASAGGHATGLLQPGDTLAIRIKGVCMLPLLHEGDLVTVQKARCYWPGDVLVFSGTTQSLMVHRLLGWVPGGRSGWRVMTRSDVAARIDALLSHDQVLGKVVELEGRAFTVTLAQRCRSLGACLHWLAVLLVRKARRTSCKDA